MSIVYKSCVGEDYYVNGVNVLFNPTNYTTKDGRISNKYFIGDGINRFYYNKEEPSKEYLNYMKRIADDIKDCKTSYCAFNLTLSVLTKDLSHRNMLLIHKKDNDIDIIHFEPHGYNALYTTMTNIFLRDLTDSLEPYFDRVLLIEPEHSCPRKLQENIPYCVMYSYFWLYIVMKVINSGTVDKGDSSWIQDVANIIYEYLEKYTIKQRQNFIIGFSYILIENFLLSIKSSEELKGKQYENIENLLYELATKSIKNIKDLNVETSYNLYVKYVFIQKAVQEDMLTPLWYSYDCNEDEDCEEGLCINGVCSSEFGKFLDEECEHDKECDSGSCINRRCADYK